MWKNQEKVFSVIVSSSRTFVSSSTAGGRGGAMVYRRIEYFPNIRECKAKVPNHVNPSCIDAVLPFSPQPHPGQSILLIDYWWYSGGWCWRGCLTKTLQGTDVSKKYKYDNSENPYKNKYKYLRMQSSIHIQIDSLYSRSIYISILRWIMMYA